MLEFQPSAMTLLVQWLTSYGPAFGTGLIVGSVATAGVLAVKMIRLRRDGVL